MFYILFDVFKYIYDYLEDEKHIYFYLDISKQMFNIFDLRLIFAKNLIKVVKKNKS